MRFWFCETHGQGFNDSPESTPTACNLIDQADCRMVEKQLVSTTPTGFLVYGEFIPYDIWLKNLPFAAPVDQVVALYAADQVGEPG